jgi:parallel beta-helix repeat protein
MIESPNNRIGGRELSQRNVVSGNRGRDILAGIMIEGQSAGGNIVQGNFIGLDATGIFAVGNEARGVTIHDSSGNYVGGALPGAGNLIAANRATGVRIWGGNSKNNLVQGNWIGVNKLLEIRFGLWPDPGILSNARGVQMRGDDNYVIDNIIVGNSWDGVLFYDGTDKDYDPTSYPSGNVIYDNTIASNGFNGVGMYDGHRNLILSNRIYGNGKLAIELGHFDLDGVTPNDPGDADSGPNDWLNYPVLTEVTVRGNHTILSGTLNSKPSQPYLIQLFADTYCDAETGHGEARYYLGDVSVTTNASGDGAFTATLPVKIPYGMILTATASDGLLNTSELSRCITVQ